MESVPLIGDDVNRSYRSFKAERASRPHVTILDSEMPGFDGLEVRRQIRAIASHALVIMLTGAGTEAQEKQARELGVTDFLAKRFSLHELGAAQQRGEKDE